MQMRLECLPLKAFHSHRRRNETAEAQRIRELCPCCQQTSETPTHFLLECPAYSSPRSTCLADAIAGTRSADQDARPSAPADPATQAHTAPSPEALDAPASAAPSGEVDAWRDVMKMKCAGVEAYMVHSWRIRRAALTGREANGGNPMALTSVPGLSAHI
jgi:hypothetical protein